MMNPHHLRNRIAESERELHRLQQTGDLAKAHAKANELQGLVLQLETLEGRPPSTCVVNSGDGWVETVDT